MKIRKWFAMILACLCVFCCSGCASCEGLLGTAGPSSEVIYDKDEGGATFTYTKAEGWSILELYTSYQDLGFTYKFSEFKSAYFSGAFLLRNLYIVGTQSWKFQLASSLGIPIYEATLNNPLIHFPVDFEGKEMIEEIGIIRKNHVYVATDSGAIYIVDLLDNIETVAINKEGYLLFFLQDGQGKVFGKIRRY